MIDSKLVNKSLVPEFVRRARRAADAGEAAGSTSEQIVSALLNGRADWLPYPYTDPLAAIRRLHSGGADWWHTLLYVAETNWRD